jgi:hypothetical protein
MMPEATPPPGSRAAPSRPPAIAPLTSSVEMSTSPPGPAE